MVKETAVDEEATLMARFVQTRDRKMFERLFQKYRRPIVAYAGRYVKEPSRAEELAQEVFVRVFTTKSYSADATFKTWLYRVATNVCLNELRRPERKQKVGPLDEETVGEHKNPEELVAGQQLQQQLSAKLAGLPEKQRAAFIMARMEGLSHDEIATALDTSIPAVKSLIHRALEALRAEAKILLDPNPLEATR